MNFKSTLLTVCALFASFPVRSAQVDTMAKGEKIVLTSDGGLEWNSGKKTLTAEKKALIVRGKTALGADKIVAHYKDVGDGKKTDVFRVTAMGKVIIRTEKQIAYADNAVYEIGESVIILKGNPVKLVTGEETLTAKRVELWQKDNMAVAKDEVVAVKDDRRLDAGTVRAYFVRNDKNATEIERFEAEDRVAITNGQEKVEGDFGVYWVERETASLQGNVKISQGGNFITGEVADINMKTGVSRLQTPSESGKPKKQVRGVFVPDKSKTKKETGKNVVKPKKPEAVKDNGSGRQQNNERILGFSDEEG